MNILKVILAVVFAQSLVAPTVLCLAESAEESTATENFTERNIVLGDIDTVEVNGLVRVSVTDPNIVDISDAKNDHVSLLAKRAGQTTVFLWDADGKHSFTVTVSRQILEDLQNRINSLLKAAEIANLNVQQSAQEGKVIISGDLNKDKKVRLEKILEPYLDQIINLTKEEESEELIQIDMQITEVSTSLDKNLGFDWKAAGGGALALDYTETGLPTEGSEGWFKFGQFDRTTAIVNTINLLVSEGKAKDLSRPRIIVSSGKEATINVGGEVPIQSTTTNATGGLTQSNITFKQYGVTLTVTPTIKDGRVDVLMNLEVSDIDSTFPIRASTTSDIAYKTRSTQTQLMLDDRQTVVFAGLVRYSESQQVKEVPFLGKIPVLGLLFRNTSKQSPDQGRELVITLTPTIVRKKEYATEQMKLPTKALIQAQQELNEAHHYETEPSSGIVPLAPAPAPVAPVPMSATGPVPDDAVMAYVRQIQLKLSQAISYPYQALRYNWEGTVKLKLRIRKDGSLADASVTSSSGNETFDQNALQTARAASPYPSFGTDVGKGSDEMVITLPIVYNQNRMTGANTQTVVAAY